MKVKGRCWAVSGGAEATVRIAAEMVMAMETWRMWTSLAVVGWNAS